MFKKLLVFALAALGVSSLSLAEENPVTGALPDAINIVLRAADWERVESNNPFTLLLCEPEHTSYCGTPDRKLNITGKRAGEGVSISPEIEGEWRWESDYRLTFTPKTYWQAGVNYTVTTEPSLFPAHVHTQNSSVSFSTKPFAARITEMKFFQDPVDMDKKLVSASIRFNYPVEEKALKDHLTFALEAVENDKKLTLKAENLPYELSMEAEGQQAVVTVPITALPEMDRFVRGEVKEGLKPLHGGQAHIHPPLDAKKDTEQEYYRPHPIERTLLPNLYSYLKFDPVEVSVVKNQKYEPERVMVITLNAPMTASELKQHLSLKLLPKDKPPVVDGQSPKKDYAWESAHEATPEMLKAAPAVPYTLLSDAEEATPTHSLKFTAEAGRWVHITIGKGLKTAGGYQLGEDFIQTAQAPLFAKEARIMSQGSVLSLSGERKLPLMSLGVEKLVIRANRVMNDNLNHLISQSYGSFSNPSFSGYGMDETNVSEVFEEERPLTGAETNLPQFSSVDFSPYIDAKGKGRGLFILQVNYKEKDKDGVEREKDGDRRLILVTDLGFLVKRNRDGSADVFVQSLEDGEPVSGAAVEVLGKNGIAVLSVKTDGNGHALLPSLEGYTREKAPVAYVVRDGNDVSFMPIGRYDRDVNLSAFDVGGQEALNDGLRAFLFSDRGIYRPGETLHLGVVVKQGDFIQDLSGLPLILELTNPRGLVVDKQVLTLNKEGLVEYQFATQDISSTGIYNARLYIGKDNKTGEQIGSTSVRVEEFLPDSLKITSSFNQTAKGWITPDALKAEVTLAHLYGAPAASHRVTGKIMLNPSGFSFGGEYKDYRFFDSKPASKSYEEELTEQTTDADGKASFPIDLSRYEDATFLLTFLSEGFVQGSGRSVKSAKSVLISRQPYVVGVMADGSTSYLTKDSDRKAKFIALNKELKPVQAKDLTLEQYRVQYVSTLVKDGSGRYSYQSLPKEKLLTKSLLDIDAGGVFYPLDTKEAGEFSYKLKNTDGKTMSSISYSVAGFANVTGAMQKNAKLGMTLDKEQYSPGEDMDISLITPYTGSGIITIETDKVLAYRWFETSTTSSIQSIEIPQGLYGKAFVNVQFVRARDDKEIYTSPFSFGVVPFMVSADAMDSKAELHVPEHIKPGEKLAISYRMKKPGKMLVFAIDEGILQYGKYKTPDPLSFMVNARALQVSTSQIFDQILPEYSLLSDSAFGGDEALADGKNLNPFKRKTLPPVVFWSGLLDADTVEKEVSFTVPEHFNGGIRVMAVAVAEGTVGAAETRTSVKGDIIVAPNAPTFVAPQDSFEIPLTITNNISASGATAKFMLAAEASEQVSVVDMPKEIIVPEGKDITLPVKVKANDIPGAASITFTARRGEVSAKYEATLSVRPAMEASTELVSGYIADGEKIVPQKRRLYGAFAKSDAAVSGMPVSLIPGLMEYLTAYPYGCTEQTLSQSFPNVVLYRNSEFNRGIKDAEKGIIYTLQRLREMQNAEGGFGYWWSDAEASDFVTIYALHYMTLAKEKNLPVPTDMMDNTIRYVRTTVNRTVTSLEQARENAYGIYLLTRNGEVTANYLPYLLQYLDENHKTTWKRDITAVYIAAAYKLMQLEPEANALMDEFILGDPEYWKSNQGWWKESAFYDSLNRYGQFLYIVSAHFPERLKTLDRNVVFRMANFIGEGSYNTLSSSFAVLGIDAYASASGIIAADKFGISAKNAKGEFAPLNLSGTQVKRGSFAPETEELKFVGDKSLGLFYQVATHGYDKLLSTKPIEQGLEVDHRFTDAAGKPVNKVTLGDEVTVTLTLRAHNNKELADMAVVDLLPGGFEVVQDSVKSTPEINGKQGTAWSTRARDVREDRVVLFGTIPSYPVAYSYRIKAVNKGTFTLPPAYAESMYERSVRASSVAASITVE